MIEKVAVYMQQQNMVQKGDHICVGVSGGADSVCLLRILQELRRRMGFTMSVVHVEHGIRGEESIKDMEFVKQMAASYGLLVSVYQYPVEKIAKEQGLSVEEAGRDLRYQAFAKEADKFCLQAKEQGGSVKVALAHHSNDNAETMLFHLCRGSGVAGLMGIRPVRDAIIRPLLCVTREEIETFLKENGQEYREDATNCDVSYSRNRIRNCIMPELEKINDKTLEHMNAFAEDMTELSEYFHKEVNRLIDTSLVMDDSQDFKLPLKGFNEYPKVLQRGIMLELLARASGSRKDITREHTKAMQDIAAGDVGRRVSLPHGIIAEKSYDTLWLHNAEEAGVKSGIARKVPLDFLEMPDNCTILQLPFGKVRCRMIFIDKNSLKIPKNQYTKCFDYDKIKNGLYFRNREPGDYFTLDRQGHRQKLKDYFINEKVPKAKREQVMLLADGSHILWALGYRISEYYKVTDDTRRVLEIQLMEEEI